MGDTDNVAFYGFTPVARDYDALFEDHPTASGDHPKQDLFKVEDFPIPRSPIVDEVRAFVSKELTEETINHCNRVYVFGCAIVKSHFPTWSCDLETFYLACILHDIGTAERFLSTTKMSFDFKGAVVARDVLLRMGAEEDQADSVCEAIIRHQSVFDKGGNITMLGQMLIFGAKIDNVGVGVNMLHPSLIENTCTLYPRQQWSDYFAATLKRELELKPWCHTTLFESPNWNPGMPSNCVKILKDNKLMGIV